MERSRTRVRRRLLGLLVALGLLLAACTGEGGQEGATTGPAGGAGGGGGGQYPRAETLYTGGQAWEPPNNWNPIMNWQYATGTVGLVYETMFLYDPLTDEYTPWLAESQRWVDDTTWEATLREGVTWTDGKPLTAEDVKFTIELGNMETVPYHPIMEYIDSVEAVDERTVRVTFSDPRYQQWAQWIYFNPIVPKHIWEGRSEQDVTGGANEDPVGTGPYLYETHDQERQVWVRNDKWWAKEALDLEVKPKYIIDIVNSGNEVALGQVLQGQVDLNNNFLPGIASLVEGGYGIQTYFDEPPYMLSANTTWLVPNTTKAPMDDAAFRRAMAFAIDTDKIVNSVYSKIVTKADPTGLLPIWDEFVDKNVTGRLGFKYDPNQAKRLLAQAGYRDTNGDGMVETPSGQAINLKLITPAGWNDWNEAARVISEGLKAAGINVTPDTPDAPALDAAREAGEFDLVLNNVRQIDNSPWQYYEYVFRVPVLEQQTTVNFARYENPQAWELTEQLDRVPVDDKAGMQKVISQLQQIHLNEMPVIPLWYNGLWSQMNTKVWQGWPSGSDDDGGNDYLPTTWRGYMQRGAIMILTKLEPAPPEG